MSSEHVLALNKLRQLTVDQRRQLVNDLANPHERGGAQDLREQFIRVQMTLEAIDRALKDEQAVIVV
jgi:hypothetical protein